MDFVAEFTKSPAVVGVEEEEFGGVQVLTVSVHGHLT